MSELTTGIINGPLTIRVPMNVIYNPQPDITAYELAQILPHLLGRPFYQEDYMSLGAAQRHLKESK